MPKFTLEATHKGNNVLPLERVCNFKNDSHC